VFQNKLEIPDEDRWQPGKPLGHGSYGAAAMLKHVNGNGKDDDVSPTIAVWMKG
jgi:hypothetical protein